MSASRGQKSSILSHAGRRLLDRRGFLAQTATGLPGIALAHLLAQHGALGASAAIGQAESGPFRPAIDPAHPFAARRPPLSAKAKNVLVIFCSGACSSLDTWDYKPELVRRHDQPMPGNSQLVTFQGENGNLIKSPYTFRPHGQSGKMTSDLLPRLGELAIGHLRFGGAKVGRILPLPLLRRLLTGRGRSRQVGWDRSFAQQCP